MIVIIFLKKDLYKFKNVYAKECSKAKIIIWREGIKMLIMILIMNYTE